MALTRVQRGMINHPAPIRWTGTQNERLALTPSDVIASDINYVFLQEGGTLWVLTAIGASELTWQAIAGAGLEGGIGINTVTGLQSALDEKVNYTDFSGGAITVTDVPADQENNIEAHKEVSVRAASDSAAGIVKIATAEEITAGVSTTSVVNAAQLKAVKDAAFARSDLTNSDGTIVLDKSGAGNSIVISAATATDAQAGVVELATDAEVTAGTSTDTVMTTKQVMDEVAKALMKDFTALNAVTANDGALADSDILAIRSGSDNLKVTAAELKSYVIAEIEQAELFKGYYTTEATLNAAWDGSTAEKTPAPGSFAIVESTDSVWVWNSDRVVAGEESGSGTAAPQWEDTRTRGTATADTQVIAGTGLTGGGAIASNVTLAVDFGTTAGTVCEGNDERLSRTPVVWSGDSTAFASVTPEDWHEGFLYVVTGTASDTFDRRVYECVDYDAANRDDMFVLLGEDAKVKSVKTFSGVISSGGNTINIAEAIDANAFLEVYLTGIRQGEGAYTVTNAASTTTITLSENVSTDIAYAVIVYPLSKPASNNQGA